MLCLGYLTLIVDFIDQNLRFLVRYHHLDVFRCRLYLDPLLILLLLLVVVVVVVKVLGCEVDVIRYLLERCHLRKRIMLWQLIVMQFWPPSTC